MLVGLSISLQSLRRGSHIFGGSQLLGLLTFWAHMGAHEGSRGAHTKSIFLSCRATNHETRLAWYIGHTLFFISQYQAILLLLLDSSHFFYFTLLLLHCIHLAKQGEHVLICCAYFSLDSQSQLNCTKLYEENQRFSEQPYLTCVTNILLTYRNLSLPLLDARRRILSVYQDCG